MGKMTAENRNWHATLTLAKRKQMKTSVVHTEEKRTKSWSYVLRFANEKNWKTSEEQKSRYAKNQKKLEKKCTLTHLREPYDLYYTNSQ